MKKINLVKTVAVLGMLTFASCQKEKMDLHEESSLQSYPDEITLDNWEQFVHAPQSVIDYHINKERKKTENEKDLNKKSTEFFSPESLVGNVQAFDGSWRGMEDVQVSSGGLNTTTNANGYYYFANNPSGPLCMDYSTNPTNGLNIVDLITLKRHLLNIAPFTEAREFIAANVDANSVVDMADFNMLQDIILFLATPVNNILFMPESDYVFAQNSVNNGGVIFLNFLNYYSTISSCLSNKIDRRAIKIGDVNGTFVF